MQKKAVNADSVFSKFKGKEEIDLTKTEGLSNFPSEKGMKPILGAKKINLTENDISTIPEYISQLQNLQHLNMSTCRVNHIPPDIAQCKQLREMIFYDNKLFFSPLSPAIGTMTQLTVLNLGKNQLEEIPTEYAKLVNLEKLILCENSLKTLPVQLSALKNLKELNISSNQLKALPNEYSAFTQLEKFEMGMNQFTAVPPCVFYFAKLQHFDCAFNGLEALDENIAYLSNLQVLILQDNPNLRNVPSLINLKQLRILNLRNMNVDNYPADMTKYVSVRELILRDNARVPLPDNIGDLSGLTRLDLYQCRLKFLPPSIGQLRNLEILDLRHNDFNNDTLPREIGELKNLKKLYLSHNHLKGFPSDIKVLRNLVEVDFGNNAMNNLSDEIGELGALVRLTLAGNKLGALPNVFDKFPNLTHLDLKQNELASLPPTMGSLQAMIRCDCSDNMITELPWEMGKLKNLTNLDLSRNPLIIPPNPVVQKGTEAMLAWLRKNEKEGRKQKVSGLDLKSDEDINGGGGKGKKK